MSIIFCVNTHAHFFSFFLPSASWVPTIHEAPWGAGPVGFASPESAQPSAGTEQMAARSPLAGHTCPPQPHRALEHLLTWGHQGGEGAGSAGPLCRWCISGVASWVPGLEVALVGHGLAPAVHVRINHGRAALLPTTGGRPLLPG